MNQFIVAVLMSMLLLLPGCGSNTMQDLTQKADKARTRQQLEAALGKADKFEKVNLLGLSAESWTYTAKDGDVNFTIVNDKIQTVATQPKKESKKK